MAYVLHNHHDRKRSMFLSEDNIKRLKHALNVARMAFHEDVKVAHKNGFGKMKDDFLKYEKETEELLQKFEEFTD